MISSPEKEELRLVMNAALRPPSYLSRATLAAELDCSVSTIDELVRRGVLPKPLRLTNGCVRWSWDAVREALASFAATSDNDNIDPLIAGARNAAQMATSRRR